MNNIYPSLDKFIQFSKSFNCISLSINFEMKKSIPLDIYKKVKAQVLIEFSENSPYSFLTINKQVEFKIYNSKTIISEFLNDKIKTKVIKKKDPLKILQKYYLNIKESPSQNSSLPFYSGFIGYFGYEIGSSFYKIFKKHDSKDSKLPDGIIIIPEIMIYINHKKNIITIIYIYLNKLIENEDLENKYFQITEKINKIKDAIKKNKKKNCTEKIPLFKKISMDSMPSKKKFILKFEKCKKYISNKEVERVVISEQFHFQTQKSPEILFQKLKKLNPSKYLFLCNFDNFYLIGSSPETMVKIINNKKVILSPLAGSKIRVKNQKQNNHNIKKFLHDKKEMREHFTVLKICRKDLEKLTITGSIKINKPEVKIFSHIMHLSSNLQGLLDPKYNVFDVIKFVFPSPALSGVPKSKAIKIISQLENVKRGPYSGILFTMGFNGFLDSCIIIRTIILDNKIATIQTGAGIGMYSKPDLEYEELCNKAKALISII